MNDFDIPMQDGCLQIYSKENQQEHSGLINKEETANKCHHEITEEIQQEVVYIECGDILHMILFSRYYNGRYRNFTG